MSVYTSVGRDELIAWLQPLGLGELISHAGIAAGMQNSNYFVTAGGVRRVLTVFEHLTPSQLDFYLALMAHLAAKCIPCPLPLISADGRHWRPLAGKPTKKRAVRDPFCASASIWQAVRCKISGPHWLTEISPLLPDPLARKEKRFTCPAN